MARVQITDAFCPLHTTPRVPRQLPVTVKRPPQHLPSCNGSALHKGKEGTQGQASRETATSVQDTWADLE